VGGESAPGERRHPYTFPFWPGTNQLTLLEVKQTK
jgi:hypothetical protein